jgi:hypothetical protein
MPLWVKKEIAANEGYFDLTSTASHPTQLNRSSSALLPYDLRDDVTCTIRYLSFTGFKAKLENPSSTRFQGKHTTRSRHMSHVVFILSSVLWHNR